MLPTHGEGGEKAHRRNITNSNFSREKPLDIKPLNKYYIMYDIMGEMGNSFNFK